MSQTSPTTTSRSEPETPRFYELARWLRSLGCCGRCWLGIAIQIVERECGRRWLREVVRCHHEERGEKACEERVRNAWKQRPQQQQERTEAA